MSFEQELRSAKEAAQRAGEHLRNVSDAGIISNSGKDIELKADREAQEIILDYLKPTPYPVISEHMENPQRNKEGPRWIVDPLDGSLNFYRQTPNAAVSIALWDGQEPCLGVVYDFNRDDMYYGAVKEGSFRNGEKISVSDVAEKGNAVLCMGFPSKADYATERLLGFVKKVQDFKKVRLLGSAALSLAYVASGKADAYHEEGIMLWDVAAGLALVKASGGEFEMKGLGKNQFDIFASNGALQRAN